MKHLKLVFGILVVFTGLGFGELNPADQARVDELKEDPRLIRNAIERGDTPQAVRDYFLNIYNNHEEIRKIIKTPEAGFEFRKHLLYRIAFWTTHEFPVPGQAAEYIFAFLSSFRDENPDGKFRDFAYKKFKDAIAPNLSSKVRVRVLHSLRAHLHSPRGRIVAVPALILLDREDLVVGRLEDLAKKLNSKDRNEIEVQYRALEAVALRPDLKRDPGVQLAAIPFLDALDSRTRLAAASVFREPDALKRTRSDKKVDVIDLQALSDIAKLMKQTKQVETRRLVAEIIGENCDTRFYRTRSVEADREILDALILGLQDKDEKVRRSAAEAFAKVKTPDEHSQLVLVNAMVGDIDGEVRNLAVQALGKIADHRFEERIRSGKVRSLLVEQLVAIVTKKIRDDKWDSTLQNLVNLLKRNPPSELSDIDRILGIYPSVSERYQAALRDIIKDSHIVDRTADTSSPRLDVESVQPIVSSKAIPLEIKETYLEKLSKLNPSDEELNRLLTHKEAIVRESGARIFSKFSKTRQGKFLNSQFGNSAVIHVLSQSPILPRQIMLRGLLNTGTGTTQSGLILERVVSCLDSVHEDIRKLAVQVLENTLQKRRFKALPSDSSLIGTTLTKLLSSDLSDKPDASILQDLATRLQSAIEKNRCAFEKLASKPKVD